mgnify:FL=1
MGFKRTVRCSYCYESGHNKSSCPALKAKIESYRRAHGDDHYLVRDWDAKKARKAAAAKTRKCSYCGEHGHNRAGCTKLKAAMAAFSARNAEYCENMYAALVESGIAPGAMIRVSRWSGDSSPRTAMVVGINWEAAHMAGPHQGFIIYRDVKHITKGEGWNCDTRLPKSITGSLHGPELEVLVTSSSKRLRATMPASYLAGSLGLKKIFKNKDYGIQTMDPHKWGTYDREFKASDYDTRVVKEQPW